jgi:hypothetical protein
MKIFSGQTIPQGKTVTGPGTKDQYGMSTIDKIGTIGSLLTAGNKGTVGDIFKTAFNKAGKDITPLNSYFNSEAWRSDPGTIWEIPGAIEALNKLTPQDWEDIV